MFGRVGAAFGRLGALLKKASSGGSVAFNLSFTDSGSQVASLTSFTFAARAIGAADATRIVAVGIGIQATIGNTTITGVTIGGVAATQATGAYQTEVTGGQTTDIWYAAVPSGTTADVVVNTAAQLSRCAVFVYRAIGTGVGFSVANGHADSGNVNSEAAAVTVPAGGGVIGVAAAHNATETITGTNLTIDAAALVVGGSTYGAGHDASHSGSTTFTFSWGTATSAAASIAAFTP